MSTTGLHSVGDVNTRYANCFVNSPTPPRDDTGNPWTATEKQMDES